MIDFHSHILPQMDDGSSCLAESLDMLRESYAQGVDVMLSTPHFYSYDEYPETFLERRKRTYEALTEGIRQTKKPMPEIMLGAEVYYFPGISTAEGIETLAFGAERSILVEPPMSPWSDRMLDEIASIRQTKGLIPVIAHLDRFVSMLDDVSLIQRVRERKMMIQVNASSFVSRNTQALVLQLLRSRQIQFIGSDCHNMDKRRPNMHFAKQVAVQAGLQREFDQLSRNASRVLKGFFPDE